MNDGDSELDRKPDSIEERTGDAKARVSEESGGGERSPNSRVADEARVSEMALDSEVGPMVSEAGNESDEIRVKSEEMESKESEAKVESSSAEDEVEDEEEEDDDDDDEAAKSCGSQFNSLLSEFDDFVANDKGGKLAASRALRYGFEVGDMVWGKVKSHPWWPGHIFNEAFANSPVRRTRREGHVLVAFFGDSSYGWFDPAEFIPFEANFTEKSGQTSSRNFTKAVEEAVDEMSRRVSLGLACKCRNPFSFRSASVPGYFVVDVPDYEPRAVYSAKQIQKARDSFRPSEALSFVKNLALSPCSGDEKDLEFVKKRVTVVAYRKAVFEEFDETYAQAFGVQPGRPARDRVGSKDQNKQPPRAPLSGPLVLAETLTGGKNATKGKKVKADGSQKDKYLLKRRDESGNLKKDHQLNQGKVNSTAPSAYAEGSGAVGDGDSNPEFVRTTGAHSSSNGGEDIIADHASASGSLVTDEVPVDTKPSHDNDTGIVKKVKEESVSGSNSIVVCKGTSTGDSLGNVALTTDDTSQSLKVEGQDSVEIKPEECQRALSISTVSTDGDRGTDQVQDGQSEGPLPTDVKRSTGVSKVGGVKKTKVKRPREEPDSENLITEGKKKKKKKQIGTQANLADRPKPLVSEKVGSSKRKLEGKAARTSLAPKEEVKAEQSKRIVASSNVSDSVGMLDNVGNAELELPRLLSDLLILALDPFHGNERRSPAIVRKFFLRYRSLVYQKSLVLSPPPEVESSETRPSKSSANDISSTEPVRDVPQLKPVKPSSRSEDPTISGWKRPPSDRHEEIVAKRSKKVSDIKSLASEKEANQKTSEAFRSGEGRESAVPLGRKTKPDSTKKSEPPTRATEPTMLVMKFPPKTSLPSSAELKARFARFGPMDQSGLRVFWKSSSCRVVFLHKSDALAACKYAAANRSLFGIPGVRCQVREFGAVAPEVAESGKAQGPEDSPTDPQRSKESSSSVLQPTTMQQQPLPQPSVQLKSCLKKSSAEESGLQPTGASSSNTRGTPRVKFMLAGEGSSTTTRVEASSSGGNRNSNNTSASFGDGGALVSPTSTTLGMDFSVRNIQKVIPPLPLPVPVPPQFAKPSFNNKSHHHHHHHHPDVTMMMGPRNIHNPSTYNISAPPSTDVVDISQQMLSLLTRCNDVVTNVTGLLGYLPYHPL